MRKVLFTLMIAGLSVAASACGTTRDQRAATGAIGGAVVAGPVGAAAGAAAGTAVSAVRDR